MLRSARQIKGFIISAKDGEIGKVNSFLFDDREWIIRYMVADTGGWLIDKLVLISLVSLSTPDWGNKLFRVNLTKQQVANSPDIDTDKPVSRQHEANLVNYYQWPAYWYAGAGYTMAPMEGYIGTVPPVVSADALKQKDEQEKGDPHLRSTEEVEGYTVQAKDNKIGHISDIIVDDEKWIIRYAVIDTSNWLPGSKKVLISPHWVERISWKNSEVHVKLTAEKIRNSPEFDVIDKINRKYEEELYDYYEYPKYW
jgi:hypothetical protein